MKFKNTKEHDRIDYYIDILCEQTRTMSVEERRAYFSAMIIAGMAGFVHLNLALAQKLEQEVYQKCEEVFKFLSEKGLIELEN